jgi:DNA oxidative demethylase
MNAIGDLLAGNDRSHQTIGDEAILLRGFACDEAVQLVRELKSIVAVSPFRHMVTPGGYRMSVAMTNCGDAGWVTDRSGYRYDPVDPTTGHRWPRMPDSFLELAVRAAAVAGFPDYRPDACLINRYEKGTRLSLHQDRNEPDLTAPIVSVSLGVPAIFLFGGLSRAERPRRFRLESGDVAVWGGRARLVFHGIAPLTGGEHELTGAARINLTFRKAL